MKRIVLTALVLVLVLAPSVARATEICGNGIDDDANNLTDEGCYNLASGQCESPLSCSETGSVSPKKGNLRYSLPPDIAPKVPWGPGVGFRRTFISQYEPGPTASVWETPMGPHWHHTYMTWVFTLGAPATALILHTSQGQDVLAPFSTTDGTWSYFKPQPGYHVKFLRKRIAAPSEIQLVPLTGETIVYSSAGQLTEIWDTLGNKVLVAHDANTQVSTVTDASGTRRLLFGYSASSGLLTSLAFQTQPPTGGGWTTRHTTSFGYTEASVTQDATSKWFVPANATEWTNLLKGSGISNPNSLWLMQETTGSLADSIGSRAASLTGSATYQVSASGWSRKGVKITTDNSTSKFSHTIPTASTSSLAYVQVFAINTAPSSGFRALNRLGTSQYEEAQLAQIDPPFGVRAQSGSNTSSGPVSYSGTLVVVTKLDHSRNEMVVYTDKQTLKPTFVNQSADTTSLLLGDGVNSSDATLLYAGLFTGTGAEFSDAQAQALIRRVKSGIGLTSVTIGGQLAQQYVYGADGLLSQVQDGAGNNIASFKFSSTSTGQVDLITTPRGTVGFEFASSRASCSDQTVLYFNKGSATTCNADTDCGAGYLCGGKTAATGSTGTCFRAARCLTVTSLSDDVVTGVAPMGPPSETCDGACAEIGGYVWRTTSGAGTTLDLQAVQDALGNYTSRELDDNGLPTHISYGDTDSLGSNGGGARDVYMIYDTNFPGRVREIRRQSNIDTGTCNLTTSTGCAITRYVYNTNGTLSQFVQEGFNLLENATSNRYSYTTAYTYLADNTGRVSTIDGPLSGANDQTVFEYWSSFDLKYGFLQNYKRKKDASSFVITSAADYDFWGNATTLVGADTDTSHATGTVTCLTFDAARGFLATRREAMAGQTTCVTPNGADLTTSFARDSALRITQITRADNSCLFYSYDTNGRLQTTKRRDDCNAASSGDNQNFLYDADGLLTEIDTLDSSSVITAKQLFSYFDGRQLKSIINPVDTSKTTGLIYDARGSLQEVDGAGSIGKTVYHRDGAAGRDNRVTEVDRYKTASIFDTWSLLYDWDGAQTVVTEGSGGNGLATQTVRDDLDRVVKLVSPDMSYPTVFVFDEASRLITKVDAQGGGASQQTHRFTYDNLGRPLNADFQGSCPTGTAHAEIQRVYDAAPIDPCPVAGGCQRVGGRLAYVKVTLLCSSAYSGTDGALDQETYYSYDDAGRMIGEYIVDDTGRTANLVHAWTKLSLFSSFSGPSAVSVGANYPTAGGNSDNDRVVSLWRTNNTSLVADTVTWFPFGPLKQYNQENKISNKQLRTRITRNLAYRITGVFDNEPISGGAANHSTAITEDAKGRVTVRDYTPNSSPAIQDSYFLYDQQDRVTCENAATISGSCPLTGTNLKNNLEAGGFTNAGDWNKILRPIAGTSPVGYTNQFNPSGYGTSHQVTLVRQSDGTPAFGDTTLHYDARGNRDYDDNSATLSHDRREYLYDGRGNVVNVHGQYFTGGVWHDYDLASAFDARNRRVFKDFYDNTTGLHAQWFFYYDALDRLSEVKYTPNAAVTGTYSYFQLSWLDDRFVYYAQTDTPSGTLSRRYIGTDESERPVDMFSWPSSGSATRVWSINPSAWGFDKNLVGPTIFEPLLFAGQYADSESVAFENDGSTIHRPSLAVNGFRTYDPFVGGYLQVDPIAPSTWSSYVYTASNPVLFDDPDGLEVGNSDDGEWVCSQATSTSSGGVETIHLSCSWQENQVDPVIGDWNQYLPPLWPQPPKPPGGGGGGGGGILGGLKKLKDLLSVTKSCDECWSDYEKDMQFCLDTTDPGSKRRALCFFWCASKLDNCLDTCWDYNGGTGILTRTNPGPTDPFLEATSMTHDAPDTQDTRAFGSP